MHELVRHLQQHLAFFTPSDLAGVLSGLHVLSFRPRNTFLRCWCESSSRLLADMTISQLAAAAAALSWAGYQLQPWWTLKFLAACQPLLPSADAEDLLLLLHASLGTKRERQQQQGKGDSRASISAQRTAVEVVRTSLAPSDSSLWLQDCLAAAAGCVAELSDEGLLQLLLTSADVGFQAAAVSTTSNDVISGTSDSSSLGLGGVPGGGAAAGVVSLGRDVEGCVRVLADALAGRMAGMSLVQLSRVVKALEAYSTSSSSSKSSGESRIKSLSLDWYLQLIQQGKAAMAAKA
eukprot:gene4817-5064_t